MPEPVATAALFLGAKAVDIVGGVVKDHVKGHVKKLVATGEEKLLGAKERDALEDAYQNALTLAYMRAIEALGNVLNLAVSSGAEFVRYRVPVESFLKNGTVAEHMIETVRDLSNQQMPDPELLEREWNKAGGEQLPIPGVWHLVAANFRKGAQERAFITPQLREVLNARTLARILELQQLLRGVQITVKHEQYVSVMRKTFAPVNLARIAPPTAEDPGTLIVTDIFEPQHVRENPPPVEITKDELENLARAGKLDGSDEQAVIAMLEEDNGQDLAQRLKFQRASYAEQPMRPVLNVVSASNVLVNIGETTKITRRPGNRLTVITGEPGSGKSMLLRYLLLGILDPPPDPDDPTRSLAWTDSFTAEGHEHFPFLVELRDYHFTCEAEPEVNSLMDYARYLGETMSYGIDDEWLDERLKSGPSLVMFDGLDEIFDPERCDHVMRQIVGFAETYPLARVIVTSRPHGYHEGILRPAGFAHFRLQDLDREQKEHFTRSWFSRVFPNEPQDAKQRIDRVLDSVDRSQSVRWLAGNPLLLTIMCLIARERELPEERAEFYEQCLDVLVHQWEVNNHLQLEDLAFLTVYRKKELLRRIAFEMQASRAGLRGNFIAEEQLLRITREWFEETYDNLKGTGAERAAQRMVQGLWQRNYVLCPRGPKLYGFLHRTFMEFLTATEFVRRFQQVPNFGEPHLFKIFEDHASEPEWREVLRLVTGLVGDEIAVRILAHIISSNPVVEWADGENEPHYLFCAINCLAELRLPSRYAEIGKRLLERSVNVLTTLRRGGGGISLLLNQFLPAVEEVGEAWPGRQWLSDKTSDPGFPANYFWGEFVAAVDRDWQRTAALLEDSDDFGCRLSAMTGLAKYWADDATRQVLRRRAVEDEVYTLRAKALELLAHEQQWVDDTTRKFLIERASEDGDGVVRAKAQELLAQEERWADRNTRDLLSQCAVEDEDAAVRARAMELLAHDRRFADDSTREVLCQCAVGDEFVRIRAKALELLAYDERWAKHEETLVARQRFKDAIREAAEPKQRGEAAFRWFSTVSSSDPLADAKRRVFSRDADGIAPFLDPRKPVSEDHLANAVRKANLTDEQRDAMVVEMSAELGWDIRKGLVE